MKNSRRENNVKKEVKNTKLKENVLTAAKDKKQQHLLYSMSKDDKEETNFTQWCINSGATSHLCLKADKYIIARGKGDIEIVVDGENIKLRNVLYSPELHINFISVGRVFETGYTVLFSSISALVKDGAGRIILRALKMNNLFIIILVSQARHQNEI